MTEPELGAFEARAEHRGEMVRALLAEVRRLQALVWDVGNQGAEQHDVNANCPWCGHASETGATLRRLFSPSSKVDLMTIPSDRALTREELREWLDREPPLKPIDEREWVDIEQASCEVVETELRPVPEVAKNIDMDSQ